MTTSILVGCLAIIAGFISSILLFYGGFIEKDKRQSWFTMIWGTLLLAASFAALEYAFWLEGVDFFDLTFHSFPLLAYFAIWFGFIVWIFERKGKRRTWLILAGLLVLIIIIARLCMNCLAW